MSVSTTMKCINGHDVKKLDKCCRKCGVQIEQQMIKCPSCEEFLNKDLTLSCTKCETKIVICNGKDGKICETPLIALEQDFCHICGSAVQVADGKNKFKLMCKLGIQITYVIHVLRFANYAFDFCRNIQLSGL